MERFSLLFISFFITLTVYGQVEFDKVEVQKVKIDTLIGNFKGTESYQIDNYFLLVGHDKSLVKLIVLDNNSKIFDSNFLIGDYYSYNLYFFKNQNKYVVLGEKADEGIWGYDVYFFDNEFRHCGSIKYAGIQKLGNSNGPSCSLIPFIEKIIIEESNISIELGDTDVYKILTSGKHAVVNGQEEKIQLIL